MGIIRPLKDADRVDWQVLYQGYADFYEVEMTADKFNTLWTWLNVPEHVEECRVYEEEGQLLGFMHFRPMPSPLRATNVCFLDDLFVSPEARGQNIGDQLLEELREIVADRSWGVVRWITKDTNYRAKSLYDRVATKTYWHTYEMDGQSD